MERRCWGIAGYPRVVEVDASSREPEDLAEDIVGMLEAGVVVEASNAAPDYWARLLDAVRRKGGNWLRAKYIDVSRDSRLLGSLGISVLEKALKAFLAGAGETLRPVARQSLSKPVSRRDLLRRPMAALMEHTSIPLVDEEACLSRYAYCGECLGSCPFQALSGKPPLINPDKCVECGLCADSCPMILIRSPAASLEGYYSFLRSLSRHAGSAAVLALCPSTRTRLYMDLDSDPGWRPRTPLIPFEVDCYPSLTIYHVALSILSGLPITYYCPENTRSRCVKSRAVDEYRAMLGEAEGILGFKARLAGSLGELDAEPAAPLLAPHPTLRSMRESLGLLAGGRDEWISVEHLPLYKVSVNDKCTLCGVCVDACPEEALSLETRNDKYVLSFNHARCTGCRACVEKCPEKAMVVERAGNPGLLARGGWMEVAWSSIARCIICGAPIGPEKAVRRVEETLRSRGVPEDVVRSVRICQRCKARRQLEEALKK